jgi:hypothetical protein
LLLCAAFLSLCRFLNLAGLLVAVLRSALNLGIKPSTATLRAMLSCCADLESRPGKTPLGLASGRPDGFNLQGLGYVDLGQVLAACQEAVEQQQQQQQQQSGDGVGSSSAAAAGVLRSGQQAAAKAVAGTTGSVDSSSSSSSSTSSEVQQLAADLLRSWAFNSTFEYVDGVMTHGPTWPLRASSAEQQTQQQVAQGGGLLQGAVGGSAVSAAAGA